MTSFLRILTPIVIAGLAVTTFASAQEKRIQRADLPTPVQKTVDDQSKGATLKGFSRETENGQTLYEAEMIVSGHSKDVLMDPAGTVVEVEEEVAIDSLPAEVRDTLQTKAGKGKLVKVEALSKHDKLVAYEAQIRTGRKRSEVQVGPDGKPLDHEE
jgi:hypothetical protein